MLLLYYFIQYKGNLNFELLLCFIKSTNVIHYVHKLKDKTPYDYLIR